MASSLPLSFLRPMSLPRPSTLHKFLNLSRPALSQSSTSIRYTSTTSTTTATSSPTPHTSSATLSPSVQTPLSNSATSSTSTITITTSRPTLLKKPYRLIRTPSNKLPIYLLWKRGGNKKLTRVRKIEGDVNMLKTDLQAALGMKDGEVTVNQLTRQVIVKGHMKPQIEKFFIDLQQ